MAPQPKPPDARQRRNKGQAGWSEVEGSKVPKWPGAKDDPVEALDYWKTVWAELGGMFSAADRLPIYRAAMLHSAVVSSARKKHLAASLGRIAGKVQKCVDAEDGVFTEAESEFLASLSADFAVGGPDKDSAKELRDLEDRLGISPKARRSLQWELQKGTGKAPTDAAPKTDRKAQSRTTGTGTVLAALE
jgi:hypothetical protein